MYKVYNKSDIVRLIQIQLEKTRQSESYIAPSGVYDTSTREAVSDFQERVGIPKSGIVDAETIERLYAEYLKTEEADLINNSSIKLPLKRGDISENMLYINRALRDLLNYYGETQTIQINNFFSENTDKAARILSHKYLLVYPGYIDHVFYSRMIRDLNSI